MWKFKVYRDVAGQFRWRLVSHNGRIVGDSGEGYADRSGAKAAAERAKRSIGIAVIEIA